MTIQPQRVVLVLSGGGMKAMAQVGVLRALEEVDLRPAEIVATSAGALMGALIAAGQSYTQIVPRLLGLGHRELRALIRLSVLVHGLGSRSVMKPEPVRDLLAALLPVHEFDELRLPLRVTAVDADTGALVVFGAGGRSDCSLVDAVLASMALPVYLPPILIGGHRYVDGGLLQVLPLDVAAAVPADLVVAVDVGPVAASPPAGHRGPPLLAAHDRALAIMMAAQRRGAVEAWAAAPDRAPLILVEPQLDPHGTFAFDRADEFIGAGYRAAHAALAAHAGAWPEAPAGGAGERPGETDSPPGRRAGGPRALGGGGGGGR